MPDDTASISQSSFTQLLHTLVSYSIVNLHVKRIEGIGLISALLGITFRFYQDKLLKMVSSGAVAPAGVQRERGQGDWANYTPPRSVLASIVAKTDSVPLADPKERRQKYGPSRFDTVNPSTAAVKPAILHGSEVGDGRMGPKPPGPPPRDLLGPPPTRVTQFTSASILKPPGPPSRPSTRVSTRPQAVTDSGSGFKEDFSFSLFPETRPVTLVAPKKTPGPLLTSGQELSTDHVKEKFMSDTVGGPMLLGSSVQKGIQNSVSL